MSGPIFLVAAAMVLGTLVVIVRTIAAATTAGRGASAEFEEVRDQYSALVDETHAAISAQAAQIAELEERLEFTERLLAQVRGRDAIGPASPP